jgi:hypothetical protein
VDEQEQGVRTGGRGTEGGGGGGREDVGGRVVRGMVTVPSPSIEVVVCREEGEGGVQGRGRMDEGGEREGA